MHPQCKEWEAGLCFSKSSKLDNFKQNAISDHLGARAQAIGTLRVHLIFKDLIDPDMNLQRAAARRKLIEEGASATDS